MSCVPNTVSFSGLSLSCVLCAQYCQCLWVVFVLCLVYPILSVSLDCLCPVYCVPNTVSVSGLSLSCVLCVQYCQILWSCVDKLTISETLSCVLCAPILSVTLDCLCPVSCVPNTVSVSGLFVLCLGYTRQGLSIQCLWIVFVLCHRTKTIQRHCQYWAHKTQDCQSRDLCLVCPILSVSLETLTVLSLCHSDQYCQCLWIVFVLCLVCPILSVFSGHSLCPVSVCPQYCQCLWIVFDLCIVCTNTVKVSGLSLSCVLCVQYCQYWVFVKTQDKVNPVLSCCVHQYCQSLWIVFVLCLCVQYCQSRDSGLSLSCVLCNPILSVLGSGLSLSCVLCAQYCQRLWIVFVLCLVCPILSVSLDCLCPVTLTVLVSPILSVSLDCQFGPVSQDQYCQCL